MIKLSFILPVYNVEEYIENCLDSILTQGIEEDEYEIICIDDGSTDKSAELIKKYQLKHKMIQLIQVENGGQGKARNIGIKNASGRFIFFVDSDDYLANNSIAAILEKAIVNNVDMICFDNQGVIDNSYREKEYDESKDSFLIETGKSFFVNHLCNNGPWWYLVNAEFLCVNSISFVEGRYCEDGMFTISCFNRAERVMYCHTDVYRYAVRNNSTVHKTDLKHQIRMIDDFKYAINYINEVILVESPQEYVDSLVKRRDSYTFFMLIRIMKSDISPQERNSLLDDLIAMGCYPHGQLTRDYGTLKVALSVLFQCSFVYKILCSVYRCCLSIKRVIHKAI